MRFKQQSIITWFSENQITLTSEKRSIIIIYKIKSNGIYLESGRYADFHKQLFTKVFRCVDNQSQRIFEARSYFMTYKLKTLGIDKKFVDDSL